MNGNPAQRLGELDTRKMLSDAGLLTRMNSIAVCNGPSLSAPNEQLPLDHALATLAAATDALDCAASRLGNRLTRVIRPYPAAPECTTAQKTEPRSVLTEDIWKSILHVNRVTDQLTVLFQNLDV